MNNDSLIADSIDEEEQYKGLKPEKIIGATDKDGKIRFLVKWKNSSNEDLVDSSIANKRWPQMVINFYEQRLTLNNQNVKHSKKRSRSKMGFDLGYDPDYIVGATMQKDELVFLMKWKNCEEFCLVYPEAAKISYPELVIEFYEKNLKFSDEDESEDDKNDKVTDGDQNSDSISQTNDDGLIEQ
jgi:hypothetical protein